MNTHQPTTLTDRQRDNLMTVGTLVTGFYVIDRSTTDHNGVSGRVSPVFHRRGEALGWQARNQGPAHR